jgi:hypothetical protein
LEGVKYYDRNPDCQFVADATISRRSWTVTVMDRLWSALVVSLFAFFVLQATSMAAHGEVAFLRAQTGSSTAGAITGTITDASGAALSGVTIAISSVALMGTRTTGSSSGGVYRIPALPPGEYSLVFTRQGFKKAKRDGIYVGLGFTATVDVQLGLESLQEDLTVVGRSTVVDKHSTAISANFNARQLSDLPTSRSVFAILSATPGVHVARIEVGGSSGDAASLYAAYGTLRANRPMVEGINVTGIFPTGSTLNFGSFDEVSVGTAAHGPEWPLPGVQMQFIVKSGGNHYHGSVYGDYENKALQSFNIDQDQIGRGAQSGRGLSSREANRLWSYHDINADVGGYITRDKAWWYFSGREQDVAARVVNFPVKPLRTQLVNYSGKMTYQLTPKNRFVAFGHAGRNHQPNRLDPFGPSGGGLTAATAINESEESTTEQLGWGRIWKGEWNSVIGDNAVFEVRLGEFGAYRREKPNGTAPRFEDVGTLTVRGGNRDWRQNLRRDQVLGSFSYFTNGAFGSHSFKAGGEIFRSIETEIWRKSYPGDVLHVLRNGDPKEVYLFQTPSRSESGLWTYAGYTSDSWRVNGRFTVNLGLRIDRYRVFLPEQTHPIGRFNGEPQTFAAVANVIDWNVIVPRIGVIHDLTGRGKSIVKFSYGHYSFAPGTEFNANANTSQWWQRYTWSDLNASGVWEPGEEDRLLDSRGGTALGSVDPRLKLPLLKEIGAWFERELPGGIGLRTGVVWRRERRHFLRQNAGRPFEAFSLPIAIPDPGPDGRLATDDDPPALHGYQLGPELPDEPPNIVRNVPRSDSHYWTWDITASRRFSRHWSLVAGFDHIWNSDQTSGYFGQSVRQNAYPLTPNDLLNAGPDGRYEFRTWSAKIQGTYEGPWGVRVTPYVRHQSGQPFGRTFTTTLNYGNVRILAEPVGTRRMDNITIVDIRVEKGIRLSASRRVAGFVDVFNVLNANPEQNTSWSSDTFLRPLSIVPPRIARIGVKVDW